MRKWKLDCPFWKMQQINKEDGFTLVELLATLSILMIVILLGGAVHIFGQRQFVAQTESANQNNDLNYALTVMSTDLRKQSGTNVTGKNNEIIITNGSTYIVNGSNQLVKNSQEVLAESISSMNVIKDAEKITIDFGLNNSTAGVSDKKYHTTIYFRGTNPSETQ